MKKVLALLLSGALLLSACLLYTSFFVGSLLTINHFCIIIMLVLKIEYRGAEKIG